MKLVRKKRFDTLWNTEIEVMNNDNELFFQLNILKDKAAELKTLSSKVIANRSSKKFKNYIDDLMGKGFQINAPILSRLYLCKYMNRSEMYAFKTGPLYKYTFIYIPNNINQGIIGKNTNDELQYNNYARFAIHENESGHKYICDMWEFISEKNTFPCSVQLFLHPESLDEIGFTRDRSFYKLNNRVLRYVKSQNKNNNEKSINAYTNANGPYIIISENFWFIFKLKTEQLYPAFNFESSHDVGERSKKIIHSLKQFTQEKELLQFTVNYIAEDIFKNTLTQTEKTKDVELNSDNKNIIRAYLIAYRQLAFIISRVYTILPYNITIINFIRKIEQATAIYENYKLTRQETVLLKNIYSSTINENLDKKIHSLINKILIRQTGWEKKS